jgi:hypothetical protein
MDLFADLPDELIIEIFSCLGHNELLVMCNSSKRFSHIYDNNVVSLLKSLLTNRAIYVENINSKKRLINICKSYNLFDRSFYNNTLHNYEQHKIRVDKNGKVYSKLKTNHTHYKSIVVPNVDNIISISGVVVDDNPRYNDYSDYGEEFLFLRNDGCVYDCYLSDPENLEYRYEPSLVLKSETEYLDDIIQVLQSFNEYFLTSKGKVYIKQRDYEYDSVTYAKIIYDLDIVKKIVKYGTSSALFLQKNGDVYIDKTPSDDESIYIKQIKSFKNIKDIITSRHIIITLSNNNFLHIYDNNFSPYDIISPINIDKIKIKCGFLFVSTIDGNLYYYGLGEISRNKLIVLHNTIDIPKCDISTEIHRSPYINHIKELDVKRVCLFGASNLILEAYLDHNGDIKFNKKSFVDDED